MKSDWTNFYIRQVLLVPDAFLNAFPLSIKQQMWSRSLTFCENFFLNITGEFLEKTSMIETLFYYSYMTTARGVFRNFTKLY